MVFGLFLSSVAALLKSGIFSDYYQQQGGQTRLFLFHKQQLRLNSVSKSSSAVSVSSLSRVSRLGLVQLCKSRSHAVYKNANVPAKYFYQNRFVKNMCKKLYKKMLTEISSGVLYKLPDRDNLKKRESEDVGIGDISVVLEI